MIKVRSSQVPRLLSCSQSAHGEGWTINTDDAAARLGTAVHYIAARMVEGKDSVDTKDVCAMYNVEDVNTANFMVSMVRSTWAELKGAFNNPAVEQSLEVTLYEGKAGKVVLTGHPDVTTVSDVARAIDWKTGYVHDDFFHQLMAYVLLVCEYSGAKEGSGTVVWLRDHDWETKSFTADQLAWLKQQIIDRCLNDPDYSVGKQCVHCQRFHECPARMSLFHQAATDIMDSPLAGGVTGKKVEDVRLGIKAMTKAIDDYRLLVKTQIQRDGPIHLHDDVYYGMTPTTFRRVIMPDAMHILKDYMTEEQISSATSIQLKQIKSCIRENLARGEKYAGVNEFFKRCESEGCMQTTTGQALREYKKDGDQPVEDGHSGNAGVQRGGVI